MKKEIRKKILQLKESLSEQEIQKKSSAIFNTLSNMKLYTNANNVMLYVSFGSEVLTKPIIDDLLQQGKRVFVPVAVPKTKELIVSELKSFEDDLEIGHFGVMEPKKDALRPVDPTIIDLIVVPGVAFDKEGYRVGYGGGYYDRFIPRLTDQTPKVSLAFEMQLIDKVPTDKYDIPVEYIITEKQFIKIKKDND